jgi:hypothetical protein
MDVFAKSDLCPVCGGSGKDPPGSPTFSGGFWGEPVRFVGWQWTMSGTAPLDDCWECEGKGKVT